MVPKFQVTTVCFSCSPPGLNPSKFTPLLWRPLNYLLNLPNYNFNINQQANQNSTVSIIKLSLLITLTSSLLFYPYQKDERVLPGNLLNIRCSFSSPEIKCLSLLPQHFLLASTLLISFRTLSLSLFLLQRVKSSHAVETQNAT
jgi:hypothetical protein